MIVHSICFSNSCIFHIAKTGLLRCGLYKTTKEEEKQQGSKDVTTQCIDFCEVTTSDVHAVLRHAPADLRGGTLLQHPLFSGGNCRLQRKSTHLCMQILHAAMFHVFEVHTYYSECWPSRRVKRHRGFLRRSDDSRVSLS